MRVWHWVSSAVCLSGFLLFTVTGITLNHATEIPATAKVTTRKAQLPADLQRLLGQSPASRRSGKRALPTAAESWLRTATGVRGPLPPGEWNGGEIYIPLPRPGGDAWINIELDTGAVEYEQSNRGWIAYFNDLHKGRHTGPAWQVFIDVLAAACLLFCLTGVGLLFLHAAKRPATWPAVAIGLAIPMALTLLLIH